MPLPIDIADAVVAALNTAANGTFGQAFSAARAYRPQFDLVELKTLRVTVVPKALEITSLSRTANQNDVAVDVAVQKKVTVGDLAELDGLMALVEEIGDYFRFKRLPAFPTALWTKTENNPVYAPEHLEQKQVFTS